MGNTKLKKNYRTDKHQVTEICYYLKVIVKRLKFILIDFENCIMAKLLIFLHFFEIAFQLVRIVFVLKPWNQRFCDKSSDHINEKKWKELLPQSFNIESDKSYVKEISESDDKFVNEEFHDDAVWMCFYAEVSFDFGKFLGQWAVNAFIDDISHNNVD